MAVTGLGPVHMPDVALGELAKREGMHLAILDHDLQAGAQCSRFHQRTPGEENEIAREIVPARRRASVCDQQLIAIRPGITVRFRTPHHSRPAHVQRWMAIDYDVRAWA
jgi:hypothetical protein